MSVSLCPFTGLAMDTWLYVLKIAIASALLSALIKWAGPIIAPPESAALILVLLPTAILGSWLVSRLSR
ncbi:MAG: hypothetical protein AAGI69_27275 [Cyanobacteria bacterium P01_H01_bin.21]